MKTIQFLALMLVALLGMSACGNDDDGQKPTIDPLEINKSFTGYIFVSTNFFKDSYYGDQATLKVVTTEGKHVVTFSDPQWGTAVFEDVKVDGTLSGTGTLTMNYRGENKTYDAILTGAMENPVITLPALMGSTAIVFYAGEAPYSCLLQGNYTGKNSVMVGESYGPYETTMTCKVTTNPDMTINVELPEYVLTGTAIGDLTPGKITIRNIAYDEGNTKYYRLYGADGLTQHFKAEQGGNVTMDSDYAVAADSYIEVDVVSDGETVGLEVKNHFKLGRMPFPIVAVFYGTVPNEE